MHPDLFGAQMRSARGFIAPMVALTTALIAACGPGEDAGTYKQADLIAGVRLDKTSACAGEDIRVDVDVKSPLAVPNVEVSVNGAHGTPRYLHFFGPPGPRQVLVRATTPDRLYDNRQATVNLVACDPNRSAPILGAGVNYAQPWTIDFEIADKAAPPASARTYRWDFGDGKIEESGVPFASHSYAQAISRDQPYTTFQAVVTVHQEGRAPLTARKTVTLWNQYALDKREGILTVPAEGTERLRKVNGQLLGQYTLTNLEDESVQFSSRTIEYLGCDADRPGRVSQQEAISLTVPARQSVQSQVSLPMGQAGPDSCGVALHLRGEGPGRRPARASIYFTAKTSPSVIRTVDASMKRILDKIVRDVVQGKAPVPTEITDSELLRLVKQGKIVLPPGVMTDASAAGEQGAGENSRCEPGDTPPAPDLSCQVTEEWERIGRHFANALKGDIVMTGSCSTIGQMLRRLTPPQRYSHVGIMTKDHVEVRHSTMQQGAITDQLDLSPWVAAVSENALRYGWPGTVTQSVDQATLGQMLLAPNGRTYEVKAFDSEPALCEGDYVEPLVVKPAPGPGVEAARLRVREAADIASRLSGHYRLFAYSDASIVNRARYRAPDGSLPTVCSSFVWAALKRAGATLNPVTRHDDRAADQDDGLFRYSEQERQSAGEFLYRSLYNDVLNAAGDKASVLGKAVVELLDLPDNVATQTVNCFASDRCDPAAEESDAWQHPGVGTAVSPDDILSWDGPADGGVYGAKERLVYREGRYQRLHRWRRTRGNGTVTGQVLIRRAPVSGARVTLSGREVTTDGAGRFSLSGVPAGRYLIQASRFFGAVLVSGQAEVEVPSGGTASVTIEFPARLSRTVKVTGSLFLVDVDDWPNPDDESHIPVDRSVFLDPWSPSATLHLEGCADEARVEVDMSFSLDLRSAAVSVNARTKLFEKDDCPVKDTPDATGVFFDTVNENSAAPFRQKVERRNYAWVDVNLSIANLGPPEL